MSAEFNWSVEIEKALKKASEDLGIANILVAGRSGVGKSTLINAVFGENFAETGSGRPVTQNVRQYHKEGFPVSIIDTRGLEMADFDNTLNALEREVKERKASPDTGKHIHVGWMCIAEDFRRVEDAEIQLTHTLSAHFPVAGIITKARANNGFDKEVQRLLPEAKNVVRVRAVVERDDDGHERKPFGLLELVQLTAELIPEGFRNAFVAAQKVDMSLKINRAHKCVAAATTGALAIGASPIPFSDVILLVPCQIGMLAGISTVFGLRINDGFLSTLIAGTAGCSATSLGGRAFVSNVLKFVPGGGSVIGGMISGATAAALTVALGEAYIAALAKILSGTPANAVTADDIVEELKNQLKHRDGFKRD